mgnify:CR=1 FL=1
METLIITTSTLTNEAMLSSDATLSSNMGTDPYAEYKMAFIHNIKNERPYEPVISIN